MSYLYRVDKIIFSTVTDLINLFEVGERTMNNYEHICQFTLILKTHIVR